MSTLRATNIKNPDSGSNNIVLDGSGGVVISGVTTVSAGSASIPSISVSGDSNTGVFFPSADTVALSSGGSERIRIDSSGRLAVGTASPTYKLEVSDGTVTLACNPLSGFGGYFGTKTNHDVILLSNNTERARIDSSGRLLIGTSSAISTGLNNNGSSYQDAESRLQVASASWNQASVSLTTYQGNAADVFAQIGINRSKSDTLGTIGSALTSGDVLGGITFSGSDGTNFVPGAWITAVADGTFSTNDAPGRLVFSTTAAGASTPTERMRINNVGLVMIGGTNATSGSQPVLFQVGQSTDYFHVQHSGPNSVVEVQCSVSTTAARNIFAFKNPNGFVGYIQINGSATSFITSSDYRLKENIVPLTGATDRLNQLQVHRFNFIADPDNTVDGFLAHEAQAVVPECVTGIKDEVDDEGKPKYQGIDQSKLVPLLTAALQEALAKIETLEASNNDLAARVAALEGN